MAAASRTDLLTWLNELLQINYTKVEQCGSGGAYCQVLDSIYGASSIRRIVCSSLIAQPMISAGDLPMGRVKMNAKHEYEFIANYKVMQNVFKAKKIDKARLA
jgi:RP/EB family microtubule-associated protein